MNRYGRPRQKGKKGKLLVHASKLEDTIIQNLEERGVEFKYEPVTFDYLRVVRGATCSECNGSHCRIRRRYTPDLAIGTFFVEIKGKLDSATRSRMEAFHEGRPEIDLRYIFQRDNWLTSKHKNKYSDWAKKLGVKYHIGQEVPEEWLIQTKSK